MIKCPSCGRDNADHFNFCLDCGYDLKAYREAFPQGAPSAPPPPQPAVTAPSMVAPHVAQPVAVPHVPTPLPPRPTVRADAPPPPPHPAAPSFPPLPPVANDPAPPSMRPPPGTVPPFSQPADARPAQPQAPVPPPLPLVAQPASAGGVACASCGYLNAPGMKFCGNCGKRLDGAPAPASEGGPGRTMFMHAADMSAIGKEKICKLITIDQTGREGMTFTIKSGETLCGRVNGIILFFDDPYVSPTHCRFAFHGGTLKVMDQGSLNGVYLRVKQERRLVDGDFLRVGRQLFRYETLNRAAFQIKKQEGDDSRIWGSPNPGAFGRLVQILEDGRTGEIRLLHGERCQLGREVGDIVMPTDGFISGRHCVFTSQNGETLVTDLGSSNGTYVRVRGEAEVVHGDFLLVGNQMLRVEIV